MRCSLILNWPRMLTVIPFLQTSLAFWTVLLVPKFPLMKEIVDFIKVSLTHIPFVHN